MSKSSLGVAVIGAGMAGRAHAAGYRSATTLYDAGLPEVRLVAIADVNAAFATDAAQRFGYERAESSWEAIASAPDIDVVSVVIANPFHRQVVEGLLGAGKHVLCEKPLAPSVEDAQAMVTAAQASQQEAAVGFTFRRSPAIAAIREQVERGSIGRPLHFKRALLVRLRVRSQWADELALQGGRRLRCPVRHRQPPAGPRRVRLRPH
jgi:predicted dehydrogenase